MSMNEQNIGPAPLTSVAAICDVTASAFANDDHAEYVREITEIACGRWCTKPKLIVHATRQELKKRIRDRRKEATVELGPIFWLSLGSLIVNVIRLLVDLWRKNHQAAAVIVSASGMPSIAVNCPMSEEW